MTTRARRVRDRSDLASVLRESMEASYARFVEGEEEDGERNLLKSYIVEAHLDTSNDRLHGSLQELRRIGRSLNSRVATTDDKSLLVLSSPKGSVEFYVDVLHERFWLLHTLSRSIHADTFLSHLIRAGPRIDRAWFPSQLLEVTTGLGRFEGFGVRFDSTIYRVDESKLAPNDEEDGWDPLDSRLISLSLKTRKGARNQLKRLRGADVFPYASALSWVRVRASNGEAGSFALEDITYHGKFTARGTSFTDHQHVLGAVREKYQASVEGLERDASIGAREGEEAHFVSGEPLVFEFSQPIRNMGAVIPRMFTSAEPYRLWGVPRRVNTRMLRVHTVDLHVGQPLTVEVTPKHLVAYLPQGTCGNTITRLYSNVQRTLDPGVKVLGENAWLGPQQAI